MAKESKLSLLEELKNLLQKNKRFIADGQLFKNTVIEHALKLDKDLVRLLLSKEHIKEHFFTNVDGVLVFDKDKFISFVDNKQFLPDSYTAFKNKIGLTLDGKDDYLKERKDVVLVWPYKDCVLEGGQTKEDQKRNEIFWNETLSPDEIDRLLEPKVLTNFKRFDNKGEHKVSEIKDTDNLIIKGNNLLALHTLKKRFAGNVKLIYIDPPYNTGGDSFQYNDSFNHSTWLTFMKNRLNIAKKLLKADGAIFVQIDYHELAFLNILLDEIFGRDNFVQLISVKTASPAGFKTVNPGPIDVTEYILFYTKDKRQFNFKKQYVPVAYDDNYDLIITNKNQKPEKWNLVPLRDIVYKENGVELGKTQQQSAKNAKKKWGKYWKTIRRQLMAEYALENSESVVSIRDPHKPTGKLKVLLEKSKQTRNKVFVYEQSNSKNDSQKKEGYVINGGSLSFYSKKTKNIDGEFTSTELLTDLWNDISWDGIAKEGDVKLKNGKKPERLIKRIIELATDKETDVVLDFHLGCGTTAAVAHKMGRQYIGIEQLDYDDNDSVVRLKNVINGDMSGISRANGWQGGGDFVYCELMEWNEIYIEKIQKAKTKASLVKIWQVMRKKGHLSYKIDLREFDENATEFEQLSFENQRRFLLDVLDKNQLYVNSCEIDDTDYKVRSEDKKLNKLFYKD